MHLLDIVTRFRWSILFALSLVAIEDIAWIIEPSLFGNVIDALIGIASGEASKGSQVFPLALWIGAFSVNSGVGALRRSLDQKIFLRMFTDIATEVAHVSKEQGLSASKTAARAQLSREFITFFEYRMPEILQQLISILGALIGLWVFDYRIAATCLIVAIPLLIINQFYNQRVVALQAHLHDSFEETYDVFSEQDPEKVRAYYTQLAQPQQRIANWGALSFGLMRIVLLGIFLVVLYIAIDLDNFTTGNIYAIVAYLWTFVTSTEYLPELFESWTSLKDISRRLKAD
jgi:ABC-type multidrug transport system fused ATPase/permease subunit